MRERQRDVLSEISDAFASGYKYILLEAPTGFGKSPVAVAVALSLGSSYICTSTKDLQTQYSRDFPYIKVAKGNNNFICTVKEDFIKNDTYKCGSCVSNYARECYHTKADYGPCMTNRDFSDDRCIYRTFERNYKVSDKGTIEEKVFIDYDIETNYREKYSQWLHLKNLREDLKIWRPCEYYHQLNVALCSSHSILNYPIFFSLLASKKVLPSRDLLILDETHLLETEIVKFRGLSISKKKWKKYIQNLEMVDYGYNDIEKWIEFLVDLETKVLNLTGHNLMAESISLYRKTKFNWTSKKAPRSKKNVVAASELFESDKEIAEKYDIDFFRGSPTISEELAVEALRDTGKLTETINNILSNPRNWIVSSFIAVV
jgi:ATP-dependent DNA helicase DinG